jgi:hypothetical protein
VPTSRTVRLQARPVNPSRLTKPAAEIFVALRLGIWAAAALALAWFPSHHGASYGTALWICWDSGWLLKIARHGYASNVDAPAFFPLYPGLTAVLGRLLGGRYALAGLTVSLASCLAAFELLWRLAAKHLDREGAFRTVLYLAIFPTTLFLQAVYSESLYLTLAVAAFTLAEARRWAWAALPRDLRSSRAPPASRLLQV